MSVRTRPPWPGDVEMLGRQHLPDIMERICRLCARPIPPGRFRSWHKRCGRIANATVFPYAGSCWCLRRQRGRCPCGTVLAETESGWDSWNALESFELDHVVPLWRVAMMPKGKRTLRWWLPGNLQALCVPCHRRKTAREAARRADLRAGQLRFSDIGLYPRSGMLTVVRP